jgi:hypothetical protein
LNLPSTSLFYYEDGKLVKRYKVGIGRNFEETPVGQFKVAVKVLDPTWYPTGRKPVPPGPANPLGTRWIGLGRTGYGVHGTNVPWTIGSPCSGGCVRLVNSEAEELFERVRLGTPVEIVYDQIEFVHDQATGEDTLIIWSDLYHYGPETLPSVLEKLARFGRAGAVSPEELAEALEASTETTVEIPLGRPASLNGRTLPGGYRRDDGGDWVLLGPLAEAFDHEVGLDKAGKMTLDGGRAPGAPDADGRWRVKVADLSSVFGFPVAGEMGEDGRLDLSTLALYLGDRLLTRQVVPFAGDFLIPLRVAMSDLGLRANWDFNLGAVLAVGEALPGAIHDYEPYVALGPAAEKAGWLVAADLARLRLTLVPAH